MVDSGSVINLHRLQPLFVIGFRILMWTCRLAGAACANSISNHKKSFPDWTEIVDIIAEGDKVVARYKSTGTHQGIFNGLDSTGDFQMS